MSQLIVPRALKKLLPFEIFHNEGGRKVVNICYRNNENRERDSNLLMSPYSKMIPASYLSEGYTSYTRTDRDICRRVAAEAMNQVEARKRLNKYLFYNKIKKVGIGYSVRTASDKILYSFWANDTCYDRFFSGDTHYTINQYSVYIEREDKLFPCAVLVIPRENYMYCKMQLLREGQLDLSKCIFLIDQELDTTKYPEQDFRMSIFRNIILPEIAKLEVTIAKVPMSYIMDTCFMKDFQFSSNNIFDRKKEEEELKKELISIAGRYIGGGRNTSPVSEFISEQPLTFGDGVISIDTDTYTWTIPQSQRGNVPTVVGENWIVGADTYGVTSGSIGIGSSSTTIEQRMSDVPTTDREVAALHHLAAIESQVGINRDRLGEITQLPYLTEQEEEEMEIESEQGDPE